MTNVKNGQHSKSGADLRTVQLKDPRLEGFTRVKDLSTIQPGSFIRYSIDNEIRSGGVVKLNKYPEYIVLLNTKNRATWCVQLAQPTLVVWSRSKTQATQMKQREQEEMERVYALYKEGKIATVGKSKK